ncbi:heterokaryon incompatibility protein-domain-containing protein [Cercophora newfieldiana]|uniref:Heterokaryon incompatibility protein-domain-containing protein n=1 Tax=Cercophora newfieldiana TaxID=92897 RepID=A0AA40CHE0_9PEZI|nr:heterokaryon incompatibility protein-domain-containing protein [Cercophora newfieldiana]
MWVTCFSPSYSFRLVSTLRTSEHRSPFDLAKRPILEAINGASTECLPYFQLLREWVRECDQSHECKRPTGANYWPTRVIFVGDPDPDKLVLVEKRGTGEDYVTLSHCWGVQTEETRRFCTTQDNYQRRLQGFSYNDLPKTFQDAVRVTRELGKQHLWIDSLCIIQQNQEDWKKEAGQMENVFASAYCTIAATSASGCRDGFLKPDLDSQHIEIQGIPGRPAYVSDFDKDVGEGPLSTRAWVLQERVLSRRTIHFSAEQTYWECGSGVRCENFTKLECPPGRHYFVLDANFPTRLRTAGHDRTVDFIKYLFKKYSRCGITFESDRDVAISGLVERIGASLETGARYGIFTCFLADLLLWKRSDGEMADRIEYSGRTVPSWSWMAYSRGIDFISDPTLVVPPHTDLCFHNNKPALIVKVRQFANCRIEQEGERYAIVADTGKMVGTLWFDRGYIEFRHCVVIGMRKDNMDDARKTYYILVVRGKGPGQGYERLGVGEVEARYVSKKCNREELW